MAESKSKSTAKTAESKAPSEAAKQGEKPAEQQADQGVQEGQEQGQGTQQQPSDPVQAQRDAEAKGEDGSDQPHTGRQGDSGPGTGVEAPEDQASGRYPSTTLTGDPEAGPLEPPTDARNQARPAQGFNESSTDHVYAEAAGRTIAGEDHLAFVDEDGNDLGPDDLFVDEDPSKTWVTTSQRISEEFYYPNTTEKAKRLVYAKGRRIPRAQAEKIKAAMGNAPEPLAAQRG